MSTMTEAIRLLEDRRAVVEQEMAQLDTALRALREIAQPTKLSRRRNLDGRVAARSVARHLPEVLAGYGVA